MKKPITRRALLKGCAAFSLGSALSPLHPAFSLSRMAAKATAKTSTLYLCFHGLMAFVLREDHILLLTPIVHEHKFLAGSWRNEKALTKGESYSLLLGAEYSNPRPVIGKDNLHLSGIKNIDAGRSYCQIKLPFPKQFISLRHVAASFTGASFTAANAPSASTFPLLQVLKYEVSDLQNCKLDRFAEGWKPDPHSSSQQLHIFAEPPDLVPDDHAARAFDALVQIFPGVDLALNSNPSLAPCPLVRDTASPREISLEQELSLSERDSACGALVRKGRVAGSKGRGPTPANCFSVIVDCC